MWAALGALLWAYALAFRQDFPTPEELRRPHDMELRHLALTIATRGDLTPDFSRGVSDPLNDWLPHRTDGLQRSLLGDYNNGEWVYVNGAPLDSVPEADLLLPGSYLLDFAGRRVWVALPEGLTPDTARVEFAWRPALFASRGSLDSAD